MVVNHILKGFWRELSPSQGQESLSVTPGRVSRRLASCESAVGGGYAVPQKTPEACRLHPWLLVEDSQVASLRWGGGMPLKTWEQRFGCLWGAWEHKVPKSAMRTPWYTPPQISDSQVASARLGGGYIGGLVPNHAQTPNIPPPKSRTRKLRVRDLGGGMQIWFFGVGNILLHSEAAHGNAHSKILQHVV